MNFVQCSLCVTWVYQALGGSAPPPALFKRSERFLENAQFQVADFWTLVPALHFERCKIKEEKLCSIYFRRGSEKYPRQQRENISLEKDLKGALSYCKNEVLCKSLAAKCRRWGLKGYDHNIQSWSVTNKYASACYSRQRDTWTFEKTVQKAVLVTYGENDPRAPRHI